LAAPEPDRQCPRCGTPAAEGQEYCLECGAHLPGRSGLVARLGSAWRRRLGWYPGDWVWPALLALVVAAVAGTASALWLADRSDASGSTLVETSPAASSVQQTTETAPEPTTTRAAPATTSTATAPPPPPPAPTQLTKWPAGQGGWTIVLDSLPAGSPVAYTEARQALRKGMKRVGVLSSSGYSSLHPGYLVVFAGIYGSEADAQGAVLNAHEHGYGGAYPRRITP
jgi:hypothetical protein